jgi:hypothetical protein
VGFSLGTLFLKENGCLALRKWYIIKIDSPHTAVLIIINPLSCKPWQYDGSNLPKRKKMSTAEYYGNNCLTRNNPAGPGLVLTMLWARGRTAHTGPVSIGVFSGTGVDALFLSLPGNGVVSLNLAEGLGP